MRVLVVIAIIATVYGQAPAGPSLEDWKMQQDEKQMDAEAAEAKQSKMSAVDKVVAMLEQLRAEVLQDGEDEAKSYNKFACFCKDTTAEKSKAIEDGNSEKIALTATIEQLSTERETLDETIKTTVQEIDDAEKEMATLTANRKAARELYEKNDADLVGAVASLNSAIEALKASKTPSLVQLQSVTETLRTATLLADALGLGGSATQKVATLLQQAPDVPMEDYKFHSDGIIETLEQLLTDFTNEKNEVDAAEVSSKNEYDGIMQEKTDYVKAKNLALAIAKKERASKIEEIAANSQMLSTVAATLLDDQEYAAELAVMCQDKAKTWDQRSQVRQDELSALTAAISIIKGAVSEKTTAATVRLAQQGVSVRLAEAAARSPDAMEAIEAEAEEADDAPAFLQLHSSPDARSRILDLLRGEGKKLKSAVLSALVSKIEADPFAKVKTLIQELIERLLKESANEANQKGWCDKATADAKQKRDYAAAEIEELNGEMASLEARIDKLTQELYELGVEITQLNQQRNMATMMRNSEKAENEATVNEAQEGITAVSQAIDILDKFYATVKKSEVELMQGPADDAPDAGFKNFEAYKGKQGSATGIIGMLEVIQGDFERTVSETEKAEANAQADYLQYMTETGKSLAEKESAQAEKTRQNNDAKSKFDEAQTAMESQSSILKGALTELMDLKPVCIDTGMSYADRVANREDEIQALNKALCILEKYEQFGPDGVGAC